MTGPRALDDRRAAAHLVAGRVELRRVGRWRFPVYELLRSGEVIARLGRPGWLRIYLGRGVRVELPDATRWRIRATTIAGYVCPVVSDPERRKVAVGEPGLGSYRIVGGAFGYGLYPEGRRRRSATWTLRRHGSSVATVHRRPFAVDAGEPLHLGAVLLSFVLVRYGLPDDARPLLPAFRWG